MIVLIPAYEPDEKLIRLLERLALTDHGINVVLVDDGSGPEFEPIFDRAVMIGCIVIGHPVNRGKGFALKRGFSYIQRIFPGHDVVCADCDGQHSPVDILRVANEVAARPNALVLGSRQFTGHVPAASRFGNTVTRVVFARSTGRHLYDTQTGLRGYPAAMLSWLQTVTGDRFEYELNVLLRAAEAGVPVCELPIETIYLEGNASSHFRPVVDSARVYIPLVKFSLSSLVAFVIDIVVLFAANSLTGDLLASVIIARVVSSTFNFGANRRLVFANAHGLPAGQCAARYFALVAAIMSVNYAAMHVLYERLGVALLPSKLLTEALLFWTSYYVQKRFIFGRRGTPAGRGSPVAAPELAAAARSAALAPAVGRVSADGESRHVSSGLLRRG